MEKCSDIDFVLTWVDGNDPSWKEKKAQYVNDSALLGNNDVRYRDWDLLRYWFRAVEKYTPWVRKIFFVTDGQIPEWLNTDYTKVQVVDHNDFIPKEYLPTFNANTIEWNLHRIPELSEKFVYFNDDMFLKDYAKPEDFFINNLPCDKPEIGTLYAQGFFEHMLFNNMELLTRQFCLKKNIKDNLGKWIKKQRPVDLVKLIIFGTKSYVPHLKSNHIQISYLKSSFFTLWEREYDVIDRTCQNKVRSKDDVTSWCVRDWQLLKGLFFPKKPIGKCFHTSSLSENDEIVKYLKGNKGKTICLNDSESERDFEKHKVLLSNIFEEKLPEKSSFEK